MKYIFRSNIIFEYIPNAKFVPKLTNGKIIALNIKYK